MFREPSCERPKYQASKMRQAQARPSLPVRGPSIKSRSKGNVACLSQVSEGLAVIRIPLPLHLEK